MMLSIEVTGKSVTVRVWDGMKSVERDKIELGSDDTVMLVSDQILCYADEDGRCIARAS